MFLDLWWVISRTQEPFDFALKLEATIIKRYQYFYLQVQKTAKSSRGRHQLNTIDRATAARQRGHPRGSAQRLQATAFSLT